MRKIIWLVLLAAFCFTLASPAQAATLYIVQRGDTLYRIALRFGVTVNALVSANGLPNANVIYVGQVLSIPDAGSPATPAPPSFTGQYVVQRGDTLYRIALRFNTTVAALKAANGLGSNLIYAGQILRIPGPAGSPPPTATPAATVPAPSPTVPPAATPCGYQWFFSNPPSGSCPAAAPLITQAAAERFQSGLMLWLSKTDTFYVLRDPAPGSAAPANIIVGPLTLAPGGSVNNRVGSVPAGYFEPVSGFGVLWRGEATQYPPGLRAALGWATEAEHSIETTYQCQAYPGTNFASPTCFLRGPSGEVLRVYYVQYFGNYWDRWPSP